MTIDGQMVKRTRIFFRNAIEVLERHRMGRAMLAGMRATAHSFGHVLRQLWLEVTGFTFLAMAAVGAMAGIREFGKFQTGHATGPGRLLLAICFTISFGWFGVSSFWRVNKRISKERN